MGCLYVMDLASYIRFEDGRVIVRSKEEIISNIPIETLDYVVIRGGVRISSKCSMEMLKRNISITFLNYSGKYIGRTISEKINIERQRLQFQCGNDEKFCLEFSKKIIKAKVNNQLVTLKRHCKDKFGDNNLNLDKIKIISKKIDNAKSIEEILGYEGSIAKLYFQSISRIINKKFEFNGRSKNPPKDAFNSLLSFGYTLLFNDMYISINAKGLNPYAGFMHKDRGGHAALVSDMMEEWRAIIIDSLVINCINKEIITLDDFIKNESDEGIYLNHEGYKKFINEYQKKIKVKTKYNKNIDYPIDLKHSMANQINDLNKCIEGQSVVFYNEFKIR